MYSHIAIVLKKLFTALIAVVTPVTIPFQRPTKKSATGLMTLLYIHVPIILKKSHICCQCSFITTTRVATSATIPATIPAIKAGAPKIIAPIAAKATPTTISISFNQLKPFFNISKKFITANTAPATVLAIPAMVVATVPKRPTSVSCKPNSATNWKKPTMSLIKCPIAPANLLIAPTTLLTKPMTLLIAPATFDITLITDDIILTTLLTVLNTATNAITPAVMYAKLSPNLYQASASLLDSASKKEVTPFSRSSNIVPSAFAIRSFITPLTFSLIFSQPAIKPCLNRSNLYLRLKRASISGKIPNSFALANVSSLSV